jgi:hypothetical protein
MVATLIDGDEAGCSTASCRDRRYNAPHGLVADLLA